MSEIPEPFLKQVFRKRDSEPEEYIRFSSATEFRHRFADTPWTSHPCQIRSDEFDLDWGNGNVHLCFWLRSSPRFLEINPSKVYCWEPCDDYREPAEDDRASGSA